MEVEEPVDRAHPGRSRTSRSRCARAGARRSTGRSCRAPRTRRAGRRSPTTCRGRRRRAGRNSGSAEVRNASISSPSCTRTRAIQSAGTTRSPPTRPSSRHMSPKRARSRSVVQMPPSTIGNPEASSMICASCSAPMRDHTSREKSSGNAAPPTRSSDPAEHVGRERAVAERSGPVTVLPAADRADPRLGVARDRPVQVVRAIVGDVEDRELVDVVVPGVARAHIEDVL